MWDEKVKEFCQTRRRLTLLYVVYTRKLLLKMSHLPFKNVCERQRVGCGYFVDDKYRFALLPESEWVKFLLLGISCPLTQNIFTNSRAPISLCWNRAFGWGPTYRDTTFNILINLYAAYTSQFFSLILFFSSVFQFEKILLIRL